MKLLVVALLALLALPLSADAAEPARAQFLNMGEFVVNGELRSPPVLFQDARDPVKFARLSRLRQSLLPRILEDGRDPVLK